MPHINVKMVAGRSEEEKQKLSALLVEAVQKAFGYGEETVSVAMEDFAKEDWPTKVYHPEIVPQMDKLYKKPGYQM